MLEVVDRDLADRHEAIMLGRESRRAKHETYLALHDNGDGTYSGKFTLPELHGSLLRTAIETLSAPRRLNRAKVGPTGNTSPATTPPPPPAKATASPAGNSPATPSASSSSTYPPTAGPAPTPSPSWSP